MPSKTKIVSILTYALGTGLVSFIIFTTILPPFLLSTFGSIYGFITLFELIFILCFIITLFGIYQYMNYRFKVSSIGLIGGIVFCISIVFLFPVLANFLGTVFQYRAMHEWIADNLRNLLVYKRLLLSILLFFTAFLYLKKSQKKDLLFHGVWLLAASNLVIFLYNRFLGQSFDEIAIRLSYLTLAPFILWFIFFYRLHVNLKENSINGILDEQ